MLSCVTFRIGFMSGLSYRGFKRSSCDFISEITKHSCIHACRRTLKVKRRLRLTKNTPKVKKIAKVRVSRKRGFFATKFTKEYKRPSLRYYTNAKNDLIYIMQSNAKVRSKEVQCMTSIPALSAIIYDVISLAGWRFYLPQ